MLRYVVLVFVLSWCAIQETQGADSVTVTFRHYGVPYNNTFVPGEFNGWGPNSNGVITPGAVSQMSYDGVFQCWVKTYVFAVHAAGRTVADSILTYKFNSGGCGSCWLTDPLNPERQADDPNGNSIIRLTSLRWFQPYSYPSGNSISGLAIGLVHVNGDSITHISMSTAAVPTDPLTTTDVTGQFDRTKRVLYVTFPAALQRSDYIRFVAYNQRGDSVVHSQGGFAVAQASLPTYAEHGVTPASPSSGDSTTFRLRISGKSHVLVRIAPSGQDPTVVSPVLLRVDPNLKDWWVNVALSPGVYEYLFELEDGSMHHDPWGRDVGRYGSRFTVGPAGRTADDYIWQSVNFQRPPLNQLVIYELNVGEAAGGYLGGTSSTPGTLAGLTTLLPYYDSLGVTALELMPIMDYGGLGRSGHSWGYDLNSYLAIEPAYGTPRDLKVFVDGAHARGIAVILDVVYNHLNDTSPLWLMQPDAAANPYFKANGDMRTNEDALYFFKDMDHWTPETQELVLTAQRMWIDEYRIDGFRYDFTQGIGWSTTDPTKGILGWANAIDQEYGGAIYQIAEHLPESPALLANSGLTSGWHDSFRDKVFDEARFGTVGLGDLENLVLDLGAFAGNDSPSLPSRYADRTGPVNATINHDEQSLIYEMTTFQGTTVAEAVLRDKLYATLIFNSLGIPMIWQGQEFSEPRGWSVEGAKLDYRPVQWGWLNDARGIAHFEHYRTLIRLRVYHPALRQGVLRKQARFDTGQKVLAWGMTDTSSGAAIMVVANFANSATTVNEIPWLDTGPWYDAFDGSVMSVTGSQVQSMSLGPYEARIDSNRSNVELGIPTGIKGEDRAVPNDIILEQNFPNPFNPQTEVQYHIASRVHVSLKVYSILGIEVATLAEGPHESGTYRTRWNGVDRMGREASSGLYLLHLVAGDRISVRKMLLVR